MHNTAAAAAVAAYAESGSAGLPGALLSQQVLDRVLDPDALVHPLGIVCNTDTGGETPKQSENSFSHFPQTFECVTVLLASDGGGGV